MLTSLSGGVISERMVRNVKIYKFDSVDSTNEMAKKIIIDGETNHLDVILTAEQTGGKGRMGNSFLSPPGGLYFSICLEKSELDNLLSPMFTIAVAICNVLEDLQIEAEIKWVNDIIAEGKKVCGILAETTDGNDFIVLGVGINANTKHIDLLEVENADSLANIIRKEVDIEDLLDNILSTFKKMLSQPATEIMHLYREKCRTIGSDVRFTVKDQEIFAMAVDVTDNGELMVITDTGETMFLDSGTVSIRGKNGYI